VFTVVWLQEIKWNSSVTHLKAFDSTLNPAQKVSIEIASDHRGKAISEEKLGS